MFQESRKDLQKMDFVKDALNKLEKKNSTFRPDMSPEFHQVATQVTQSESCTFQTFRNRMLVVDLKEAFTPAALERILEACHFRVTV